MTHKELEAISSRKVFLAGWRSVERHMTFERQLVNISLSEDSLWMPIYTQSQHEFRLHKYLVEHKIPVYLPLVPDIKIHNVRRCGKEYSYKKSVLRPMFGSYIFAQMTEEQKREIYRSNSVINIWSVSRTEQVSFIKELHGIQVLEDLAKKSKLEFHNDIKVNDQFIIESPPYEGTYGYLIERRKKFLWVVKLEFLNMAVLAQIDPSEYKIAKVEV